MIKFVLLFASFLMAGETATITFTRQKTAKGTEYLRLQLPKDSLLWTCYDQEKYAEIIETYRKVQLQDSMILRLESNVSSYKDNSEKFNQIGKLFETNELNYVNLVADYKKYSTDLFDQMVKAESKKYQWGLVGFLAGLFTTATLVYLVK